MNTRVDRATGLTAAALVAMGAVGLMVAPAPAQEPRTACEITMDEPIPVQTGLVVSWVRHSAPLEGRLTATFPAEAKVTVVSAARAEAEPLMARLTLGTAEAVAGEYDLVLKGEGEGECTGKVKIGAGSGGSH